VALLLTLAAEQAGLPAAEQALALLGPPAPAARSAQETQQLALAQGPQA
jgi:hypothetical protein